MRKLLMLSVLVAVMVLSMTGIALANFGPHGGYLADTDACAGCHRAHTAPSPLTWTDNSGGVRNALLLSTASLMYQFCYTCHGNGAPGAATDVEHGVFDSSTTDPNNSVVGATLNGGGFDQLGNNDVGISTTSTHEIANASWGAWGGGFTGGIVGGTATGTGERINMDCTSCHDPHGSSNYRILKDSIFDGTAARTVGGYGSNFASDVDPAPDPYVISVEQGYPLAFDGYDANGFRLHSKYDGATVNYNNHLPASGGIYPQYKPDYTTARYATAPDGTSGSKKGMSGWCVACHSQYLTFAGVSTSWQGTENPNGTYDALDGYGSIARHRHPVNVPLTNFYIGGNPANGPIGDRALVYDPPQWQTFTNNVPAYVDIPLGNNVSDVRNTTDASDSDGDLHFGSVGASERGNATEYDLSDWIDCLTCHRAHGSEAQMTGYANVADSTQPDPDTGVGGVDPTNDSALLRADNRGVCERCHNK